MAARVEVDFSKDTYALLKEQIKGERQQQLGMVPPKVIFHEWDVLKELDRRAKRKARDVSKGIRQYMREHPEEVQRVREKYGLSQ